MLLTPNILSTYCGCNKDSKCSSQHKVFGGDQKFFFCCDAAEKKTLTNGPLVLCCIRILSNSERRRLRIPGLKVPGLKVPGLQVPGLHLCPLFCCSELNRVRASSRG
ncbi:hypothetical protein NQD34_011521 [Periophthalmus magnuspinnatus]|nr:hypothetical protein NQD34_011521 [Periophthalmus magnuspinnatus]